MTIKDENIILSNYIMKLAQKEDCSNQFKIFARLSNFKKLYNHYTLAELVNIDSDRDIEYFGEKGFRNIVPLEKLKDDYEMLGEQIKNYDALVNRIYKEQLELYLRDELETSLKNSSVKIEDEEKTNIESGYIVIKKERSYYKIFILAGNDIMVTNEDIEGIYYCGDAVQEIYTEVIQRIRLYRIGKYEYCLTEKQLNKIKSLIREKIFIAAKERARE